MSFLGRQDPYDRSRVVFLPVPYEGAISYGKGASRGPEAIIDASRYLELYDEELSCEPWKLGFHTLAPLKIEGDSERMSASLYGEARAHIDAGKFLVVLGGDHSITSGEVRAYSEKQPRLSVLHIDAHTDLRDEFMGNRHSHACAMRRSFDFVDNIVQVGIRSISQEEVVFARGKGHDAIFYADAIRHDRHWIKAAVDRLSDEVFVSIDVDGFDPSIMPATGTPEPGGLSWWQVTSLLKETAMRKRIVGFDIVELAPITGLHHCEFTIAKLAYRLVGYAMRGCFEHPVPIQK